MDGYGKPTRNCKLKSLFITMFTNRQQMTANKVLIENRNFTTSLMTIHYHKQQNIGFYLPAI